MRRRTRPATLPIGTVSHGTLREPDLLDAFLDTAERLHLSRAHRFAVRAIRARYDAALDADANGGEWCGGYWEEDAGYDLEELQGLLESYTPDYCYFGAHEGDGADFGVWPISEVFAFGPQGGYDGCIWRLDEGDHPNGAIPPDYTHALAVNDHGNATLYRRAGRRWLECWSVV